MTDEYQQDPPFAIQAELTEGCPLRCSFCFGVAHKNRVPLVSMAVGPKLPLTEIIEGDRLLTFDENMKIVETTVVGLVGRVVTEWLRIKIGKHKSYDVTPEHPFFTARGLVPAGSLMVGDQVLEVKPGEIISWKKQGDKNPMTRPEVKHKNMMGRDYKAAGRKVSDTIRRKQADGTYVHPYDNLTEEHRAEMRRQQSESKLREKNPNWKGVCPNLLDLDDAIHSGKIDRCQQCGARGRKLLVHHKDGHHGNDDRNNLVVWCHPCHDRHHDRELNFTKNKPAVKKHNGREVVSIERRSGQLPVMNLRCAPYNTFLADGLWVHNCGLNGIRSPLGEGPNVLKFMKASTAACLIDRIKGANTQCSIDGRALWHPRIEFAMHGEPSIHPDLLTLLEMFRKRLASDTHLMMTSNGAGFVKDPTSTIDEALKYLNVLAIDWYEGVKTVPRILDAYRGAHYVWRYPEDNSSNPHRRRAPNEHDLVIVQDIEKASRGTHSVLNNHCGCGAPPNDSAQGKRCAKPFREMSIRWDGNVAICCNDWRGHFKCGNILTHTLEEIWNGAALRAARKKLYRGERTFTPCLGCDALSYRPGLLPDHKGLLELPPACSKDDEAIKLALGGGTYTLPVLREWELPVDAV